MSSMFCYCLACKSGSEDKVARYLEKRFGYKAMAPVYQKREKKQGAWYIKKYPMMVGYVFFFSLEMCDRKSIARVDDVYKLLTYDDGSAELAGGDKTFAEWLYGMDGDIGISRVFMENQRIKVIEGPLLGYEGSILKIDRRKQSAMVRFKVGSVVRNVWLSYDLITS